MRIFHGNAVVATHRRSQEPHARITQPEHFDGLMKRAPVEPETTITERSPLEAMGRSLGEYAALIRGDQ